MTVLDWKSRPPEADMDLPRGGGRGGGHAYLSNGHGRDESRSNKTLYDHGQDVPNYGTSVGHEHVLNPLQLQVRAHHWRSFMFFKCHVLLDFFLGQYFCNESHSSWSVSVLS